MLEKMLNKAERYLDKLCIGFNERTVGTQGNLSATDFFRKEINSFGWQVHSDEFTAIDWVSEEAKLQCDSSEFKVFSSPYSPGCSLKAELVAVSTFTELKNINTKDKIILLYGDIAKEQLMPKNFVFYNPEEHRQIVTALEQSGAKALICATERSGATAGGVYPFPLIEDGDFDIPSIYMTEGEGKKLIAYNGKQVTLHSDSRRIPSKGYNVIAQKGNDKAKRIVVTAHIDAKKGTPGAIDNATGVIILLLLADILRDYEGGYKIEIVALNGEDYYAVPGQMSYIAKNENKFDDIVLNINIDGAGYKDGGSVFSYFNFDDKKKAVVENILSDYNEISEGVQWPQGDHSIFVQFGRKAIAVTSKWFLDNFCTQDITHTHKDNPSIVDCEKLVYLATAISDVINNYHD